MGNYFYLHPDTSLDEHLIKLENVCWLRSAPDWQLRTIKSNGRMINNEEAILLTCNILKKQLGIDLDENELKKELAFAGKVR